MNRTVPSYRPIGELVPEAAAAIRAAHHVAQLHDRPGLLDADQLGDTVGALHDLAADLPELLDRLATFLSSEQAAGRLSSAAADVSDLDLARAARDAREQLGEASRMAVVLAEALGLASAALGVVGKPWNTAAVRTGEGTDGGGYPA
ncbi:hypothetical protein [Kitasatospora sp. NPDC094015]|uniref:hypothetical protein n=1 Tax=Kitasatospora sp. NPDC094015 TaxID=3155205 RepID=UPI00332CE96E